MTEIDDNVSPLTSPERKRGPHLTKTQQMILRYIAGETAVHGGARCTKRELAAMFGRNVKTIDRCIAGLRREGLIEARARFDEKNGAQLSSEYRVLPHPIT